MEHQSIVIKNVINLCTLVPVSSFDMYICVGDNLYIDCTGVAVLPHSSLSISWSTTSSDASWETSQDKKRHWMEQQNNHDVLWDPANENPDIAE